MNPDIILLTITCVGVYLLAFIAFFNPLKVNVIANKWFGVFLFSVGSAILDTIITEANAVENYKQLIAFNGLSRYALAPALYLSVLHYTLPEKTFSIKESLHFLPFFVFFICTSSFVINPGHNIFNPATFPAWFKTALQVFIRLSIPTQLVVYWILSYYKLTQHQKNIKLVTSDTVPVSLNWLMYLLFGILFMILISISGFFSGGQLKLYYSVGYLVGMLLITYFLLAQKEIYPYENTVLESISIIIDAGKKDTSVKQRFSAEILTQLKEKMINLMESERLFLDNELSLPDLAKEMGISPHDLSYLLNEGFGVNFFQFINRHRVNEAKQLMLSDKYRHLNLLGIAYNAGFNSKTTFNTAFKKETGLSPSQFIQQAKTTPSFQ